MNMVFAHLTCNYAVIERSIVSRKFSCVIFYKSRIYISRQAKNFCPMVLWSGNNGCSSSKNACIGAGAIIFFGF